MKVSQILMAAKAKIANPANWIQGEFAKDKNGYWCAEGGTSERATCFCSMGAIEAVVGVEYAEPEWCDGPAAKAQDYLSNAAERHMPIYNDNHTHEEVMAVWDKAIAAAIKDDGGDDITEEGEDE